MTGLGQRTLLLQTALVQPLVGQSERRGKARHRLPIPVHKARLGTCSTVPDRSPISPSSEIQGAIIRRCAYFVPNLLMFCV